ncbi:hypothetical protein GCM10010339_78010 [Streptomyces alanosinicus]|uniref:M23 family metallopeptidase n=1 Tax=Streptomyces alanosinicus TaxID=68171 RepID=A0A918YRM5_9ACTN|nr:hypothetical protein GCM10010339_78010 [Streptomyces alanosinicus]
MAPEVQDSWISGGSHKPYFGPDRRSSRRSVALSAVSTATVPTGIDLWLGRDAVVQAPAAGKVLAAAPGHVELTYGAQALSLTFPRTVQPAVTTGATVQAGEDITHLGSGASIHVALRDAGSPAARAWSVPSTPPAASRSPPTPPRSSASRPTPALRARGTCSTGVTPRSPPCRSWFRLVLRSAVLPDQSMCGQLRCEPSAVGSEGVRPHSGAPCGVTVVRASLSLTHSVAAVAPPPLCTVGTVQTAKQH